MRLIQPKQDRMAHTNLQRNIQSNELLRKQCMSRLLMRTEHRMFSHHELMRLHHRFVYHAQLMLE